MPRPSVPVGRTDETSLRRCPMQGCIRGVAHGCRGLCMICYSSAKKMVEGGETTWEELESLGLVQPKVQDTPFTLALKKLKGER